MKVWQGIRSVNGAYVSCNGVEFDKKPSLKVRNHSPDGFEWGYGGSGPAQLALGILLEVIPVWQAQQLYQRFKAEIIAGLNQDGWLLNEKEVMEWVGRNQERLTANYKELEELPDDVVDIDETAEEDDEATPSTEKPPDYRIG